MNDFVFSQSSLNHLKDVVSDLQAVTHRALELTECDFAVIEGKRTLEEQKELVEAGASLTLNSAHLTNEAVDLVPYLRKLRWDWPLVYKVANAMRRAAVEKGIHIIWGGVWDLHLNFLSANLEEEVSRYAIRMRSYGKTPFLDGCHFEMANRRQR